MIDLCGVFENKGQHMGCCHKQVRFSERGRCFTKELIEGRMLIGRIDPYQSTGLSKGTVCWVIELLVLFSL